MGTPSSQRCIGHNCKSDNSNVHRILVDNGSTVDIIYLDAYKRTSLTERKLSLTTSPFYGFTGDHVIPKGTIKLAVTEWENTIESQR